MRRLGVTVVATLLAVGALGAGGVVALAAGPANDDFANATVITALPYTDTVDNTTAGVENGEPQSCWWSPSPRTIWYQFTPSTAGLLSVNMAGSEPNGLFTVWRQAGSGFAGLEYVGCEAFQAAVTFAATAGTTYYIQAGDVEAASGGLMQVNVTQIPAPANDDFADARVISALPFGETVDTTAATGEADEPQPQCFWPGAGTVWYAFTPDATATLLFSAQQSGYLFGVAVYSGDTLGTLQEAACGIGEVAFRAEAGVTYHLQVFSNWTLDIGLRVAPLPTASFGFFPGDPSMFDDVQFYDSSWDPAGQGIATWSWSFGDGATSTSPSPQHRFAADGDYSVGLTVATTDGRVASTSQVVHVATHDVAITRLSAPTSASVGQTRQISVAVRNTRYPETVQVLLFRSVPGGWEQVGSTTQLVPVRPANRTTSFTFSYTFRSADGAIGKVSFRAEATLVDARDALPADNVAISTPTKVAR